jgi:prolyl oligopeptidase
VSLPDSRFQPLRQAALTGLALVLVLSALPLPAFARTQHGPVYPPAYRDRVLTDYFGTFVPGPYRWMEKLDSPRLRRWIAQENRLTLRYFSRDPLIPRFEKQLRVLWNHPKEGVPVEAGGRLFYSYNNGLENQSVVMERRVGSSKARVVLNPNLISPSGAIALANYVPSPNGRYLAYALSVGGSDWQTIHVLDLRTGRTLPHPVRWVKFSNIAWTRNSRGFYYSRYPKPPANNVIGVRLYHQALYYHRIDEPQSDDRRVVSLPHRPEWIVDGSTLDGERYLFVTEQFDITRNELYVARIGRRPGRVRLRPLFVRNDASYTPVGVVGRTLFIETDKDAPLGRVIAVDLDHPGPPARWKTVVPETHGVLVGVHLAAGRLVVHRMVNAVSRLSLYSTSGRRLRSLPLPGRMGTASGFSTHEDSPIAYYAYTSFLHPTEILRLNVKSARGRVLFAPHVPFDAKHYVTREVFYRSTGGVKVPMFLVERRGLVPHGETPTILTGYGGFDITNTPYFDPMVAVWIRDGGVYAEPNLRGGGVYGQAWHHAGMLGNKQHVFDDFYNAAYWLIRHRITDRAHLGIMGYSNGGLLTGASVTQKPHLFGAVYVGHGVLDMLRFEKFSGGEYWIAEYGDPRIKADFRWLYAYSPVQNVRPGVCYPPTLITTSTDDDRVDPSNSYKFAATMQHDQGCANPILLHVAHHTSHIYMPTDKLIRHKAEDWGFVGYHIGMKGIAVHDAGKV